MKQGWLTARHHIVFLLGLATAFAFVFYVETLPADVDRARLTLDQTLEIPLRETRPLNGQERDWANIAWQYFENNYQPGTGLVNSVDSYPSTTMWDTASYMMALIAAQRLALIDMKAFDARLHRLLTTLEALPLFDNKLPNKVYHTQTLDMVDYENQQTIEGIGWSAIDLGRLGVPFNILVWHYPEYTAHVKRILARWDMRELIKQGHMYGARVQNQLTEYVQEGRIGYEEYAAKSFALLGKDVTGALLYRDYIDFKTLYGVDIPIDRREADLYHANNYVVSESYILDMLEYGGDDISTQLAYRVYLAQARRYKATGQLTAVSEDNIDQPPYFLYNTLYSNGESWNVIDEQGNSHEQLRTLSTKAAFGWYALYDTDYSDRLIQQASALFDKEKGWLSGYYEHLDKPNKTITANTNAVVLESLLYINDGQILALSD